MQKIKKLPEGATISDEKKAMEAIRKRAKEAQDHAKKMRDVHAVFRKQILMVGDVVEKQIALMRLDEALLLATGVVHNVGFVEDTNKFRMPPAKKDELPN